MRQAVHEALPQALRELGYVEGKNIVIEYRWAEGKSERLSELAIDLARSKVDVIVAPSTLDALAAQKATKTIPIVMVLSSDPVGTGLVANLARPGGHITGLTTLSPELNGKRLELLKETLPKLARVGVLWNVTNPDKALEYEQIELTARQLKLQLQSLAAKSLDDFEKEFRAPATKLPGALLTLSDMLTATHQLQIVELATKRRLPAIFQTGDFVDAGGLMSYGPSDVDLFRRAATYVDKILKGTKPGDLPVQQPTKFELVINLKTAKKIGLTVPPAILFRADRVLR
jgi:putative ABC transport system substrate-binding protein